MEKIGTHYLVVDDDEVFCSVMQRALVRRGFSVDICFNLTDAEALVQKNNFDRAIVDLKIAQESGLILISRLKAINPSLQIIMLTGYASITTAVEAIKLGALNYFCKPVDVDDVVAAFDNKVKSIDISEQPTPLDKVEWEHIQQTLLNNNNNITATAKALGMHRRTLQRKLMKRPPN